MADSEKYNIIYRGVVSPVGSSGKYSVLYCQSDAQAEAFASAITPFLANNTQVGVSKVVRAVPNFTVNARAASQLTDVLLYRFTLVAENTGAVHTIDIPLNPNAVVSDVITVITANCTDRAGNALKYKSARIIGQNVVTGGVVDLSSQPV